VLHTPPISTAAYKQSTFIYPCNIRH